MYKIYTLDETEYWEKYLERFVNYDVQYMWQYLFIYEKYEKSNARLFVYEDELGLVYYPFLLRAIDYTCYYDITSQYGYGGPLILCDSENINNLIHRYRKDFEKYCLENNIVSEFIRFHPMLQNHVGLESYIDLKYISNIIYVDLTKSEEDIWKNYKHSNRKCINKALRENVEVFNEVECKNFNSFYDIYINTMDRNNAKNYYYFSTDFFYNASILLKNNVMYFYSVKDKKIVSTELVLYSKDYVHSFLGGTLNEYFEFRPNNILKHEIILEAKKKGVKYFILGGGYKPDDGIYNYKKAFNPNGEKEFYVGKKVHNIEVYNNLVKKWNEKNPNRITDDTNFFPLYRRV